MNFGTDVHLRFSCGIFGGRLHLNLMTRWKSTLSSNNLFLYSVHNLPLIHSPTCSEAHKTQTFNYAQVPSLSSSLLFPSFPKDFCFSHTLTASFLPCIRLLLFNSGRPDVHLITALSSRTRAENSLGLFSPAAMASGAKIYSYRHKYRRPLL